MFLILHYRICKSNFFLLAKGMFLLPCVLQAAKPPQAIAKFNRTHFYSLQQFPASRPYFSPP
ncbi:hypothetical protein SGRA_0941 [Saprospira grandis str. Lewin]|uniref:Secreted protein n=1 Tax=Saprospira grandis (strain Lewin) TaxID=984262 RepID=H6L2V0_SAPGL|nr:hypothetical protein SGRA_0941 [Saprospira grandis str. Lewin]